MLTFPDHAAARARMLRDHLRARDITSPRVLAAMDHVPREHFVPGEFSEYAYDDGPLPIGEGQTISQPYIVAFMIQAAGLRGGERVLEIGTGSGYAAAVLAEIATLVHSVERLPGLARKARDRLARVGCSNVRVHCADGTLGWPDAAPYDAILVTAGAPRVPEALLRQLRVGGRLVIPVGDQLDAMELLRITRCSRAEFETDSLGSVRFVPLVGADGWAAEACPAG